MKPIDSYITVLKREYQKRKLFDSNYSLAAFARFLGCDVSDFVKAMSRKRDISLKAARTIISKLELGEEEGSGFLVSVTICNIRLYMKRNGIDPNDKLIQEYFNNSEINTSEDDRNLK